MVILCIEHIDFTIKIECSKYYDKLSKARSNYSNENILSDFHWGESDILNFFIDGQPLSFENHICHTEAFFYDNTDYSVWVDFKKKVDEAMLLTYGQTCSDDCSFYKAKGLLSGFVNYKNDIGRSFLEIRYNQDNKPKSFRFEYDVLSTKLDYHDHWRTIITDVEAEYRMLSIDFLRRTYHGFMPTGKTGETPEIIWWNIFRDKQNDLIKAVKNIINRPKQRLRDVNEFLKAEKIHLISPCLENELAEYRNNEAHLYRVAVPQLNHDTIENRFLKYAIISISKKFNVLSSRILNFLRSADDALKCDILRTDKELRSLIQNPFFRNVGRFKGFNQENLTLQRASGYSEVYRIWILLNMAYSLENGILKLETKDIATLYEIWCFIQVKNIVAKILGDRCEDFVIDNQSRKELNNLFVYELEKGEFSRIIFKKDEIQLAELIYNPVDKDGFNNDLPEIESRTTTQKPDIVLQLTKDDRERKIKLTYVFDAKYRIADHNDRSVGTPPGDAIDQMHRYRDALYYKEYRDLPYTPANLKKEVIGGYILFPGDGDIENIQKERFFQSIKEVNIGAFPLKPGESENRALLENFISDLIDKRSDQLIGPDFTIAQKGLKYADENILQDSIVLIGYCKSDSQLEPTLKNMLYYVRIGDADGSVCIDKDMVSAEYLLLHDGKDLIGLYKITKNKSHIYSKNELIDLGFSPSNDYYLCFKFYNLHKDDPMFGYDLSKLSFKITNKHSMAPRFQYLKDLL